MADDKPILNGIVRTESSERTATLKTEVTNDNDKLESRRLSTPRHHLELRVDNLISDDDDVDESVANKDDNDTEKEPANQSKDNHEVNQNSIPDTEGSPVKRERTESPDDDVICLGELQLTTPKKDATLKSQANKSRGRPKKQSQLFVKQGNNDSLANEPPVRPELISNGDAKSHQPSPNVISKKKQRLKKTGGRSKKKPEKSEPEDQSKLTDFYPVRRSNRVPKSKIEEETRKLVEEAIIQGREDGLKVAEILGKGRGVLAARAFSRHEFVVEYAGDLIGLSEAKLREKDYECRGDVDCYMYFFQHGTTSYCVDATAETRRLGRLINHSKKQANCATKLLEVDRKPRLVLVALRDIDEGEELLYDYGDRSKTSMQAHPWLCY